MAIAISRYSPGLRGSLGGFFGDFWGFLGDWLGFRVLGVRGLGSSLPCGREGGFVGLGA